jgi:PAS domain S-box-containing protein
MQAGGLQMRSEYPSSYNQLLNRVKELELELAEQHLAVKYDREEKKVFDFLVQSLPDVIYKLDISGKIQFVNRAVQAYGYQPETLTGRNFLELVHPDDVAMTKQRLKELRTGTGDLNTMEVRFVSGGGETVYMEVRSQLVDFGDFQCILGIALDYTEMRKMEAQISREQKMEALGALAGGIAHDFNNILTGIIGYTEIALTKASSGGDIAGLLAEILQGGFRAKELVAQILAFSSQKEQENKPVQVNLIVKEALKLLRASVPSTIEFQSRIQEEPTVVVCNPTQFHQVVMNLCTNAAQSMDRDGGELGVRLSALDVEEQSVAKSLGIKPGPYVHLTVSDTGGGMDKETMERIFEPYFTTKDETGGTGLGLWVVHSIVKGLGGAVKVYSEKGQGAIFHLYLPRVESSEIKTAPEEKNDIPEGCEHILLVDDELVVLEITEEILVDLGYQVTSELSSVEALATFRKNPDTFDMVLTDLTMPGLTGMELITKIQDIRRGIPVVIFSGFDTQVIKNNPPKGVWAFVKKPVFIREIAVTIREIFDKCGKTGKQ